MIAIEKGIPISERGKQADYEPTPGNQGKRGPKYLRWFLFEVGDSAFVPGLSSRAMSPRIAQASKRTRYKFTVRSVVVGDIAGVRIWRTE